MLKAIIKENILHHSSQPHPRPSDPYQLHHLVYTSNNKCTCDLCSPSSHKSIHPHSHITHALSPIKNKYSNTCFLPLRLHSVLRCEAMHLARQTIAYSNRPKNLLNQTQLQALSELNKWKHDHMALLLGPCSETNREKLISAASLRQLWGWVNSVFLDGDHTGYTFRWNARLRSHIKARAFQKGLSYCIELHPSPGGSSAAHGRVLLSVLSSLVHEALHVFFLHYACPFCRTAGRNLAANGHGRAWQLLATHVERMFLVLTGLPLDLGRFTAVWYHWKYFYPLPSRHDLQVWRLEDAGLVQLYADDLVEAYRCEKKPEAFRIREFCGRWWEGRERAEQVLRDEGVRTRVTKRSREEVGCGGVDEEEEDK